MREFPVVLSHLSTPPLPRVIHNILEVLGISILLNLLQQALMNSWKKGKVTGIVAFCLD